MDFASFLKSAMGVGQKNGLSQRALADLLTAAGSTTSQQLVSLWLTAKVLPGRTKLPALRAALNLNADQSALMDSLIEKAAVARRRPA